MRGFTLIELMIVVALFAIMLALALPSFNGLIERFRIGARLGALEASMSLARVEAIRRGQGVTLVSRSDCQLAVASASDWSCGWHVQVGTGSNAPRIKSEGPDRKVVVMSNQSSLTFNAFGQPQQWASFQVSPDPQGVSSPNTVKLCVGLGGRMRRQPDAVACQ